MNFWKNCRSYRWLFGLAAAVLFFAAGAALGQFHTIWQKAVIICLECIGIG